MAYRSFVISLCALLAALSGIAEGQSTYNPDTQNVYHLFTRSNPTISQPMLLGVPSLIGSNFNPSGRMGVLIHGWNSGPTSSYITSNVPLILQGLDVNLLVVDWSAGAVASDQDTLINVNVPAAAASIARFLHWLNLETGATLTQYHVMGFEVGAHVAGMVGRNLNGQLYYLTALNPPRTGWNSTNMFRPSDALYTDAIHTDIFGTGMMEPCAHVDFYPNGGFSQPGCDVLDWECSRDRSYMYFGESVASAGFTSTLCDTVEDALKGNCDSDITLPLGGITNKTGTYGIYYLPTNAQSPFSMG